ncbi:MAG: rhomboid family intramembrane serine protease [Roseiflexus sp.]|nr:rhomboid family intramembrane serine protease [Roseiflexus sp.]MDW8148255.1 rhomboid family intramembrane serine protease [Roseiflexaceae bacterium]
MLPLYDTVQARSFPFVNWSLIVANIAIFLVEVALGADAEWFVAALGVVPARLLANPGPDQIATLFTSMFLHGGWSHLLSNMLALYIFGDNVEDRMGGGRYLAFYLICGVIAALTHVFFNPDSPIPTIGASGAISGVLGAYLILYPTARVITLIPVFFLPWFVEIPALVYLGMWFLSQLLNGTLAIIIGAQGFGGVAWWAHAGGFVAGIVLVGLFIRRRNRRRVYVDEYWPW